MAPDSTRRGFLRFLGLGAAAAVAAPIIKPKAFFSFFTGEVWKPMTAQPWQVAFLRAGEIRPRRNFVCMNRRTYEMLQAQAIERMVNPPLVIDLRRNT